MSAASSTCRVCGATEHTFAVMGVKDWEYGVEGEWAYRRCSSCGLLQLEPFPTVEDLVKAYDVDYYGYRTTAEKGRLYKLLFDVKDGLFKKKIARIVPRGAALLDVGCGSGEYLRRMSFLEPSRIDGIDFNETAVELARSKGVDCFQGIFPDFPGEPDTYDAVFMNNYLEHTLDPGVEVEKALRLLKPGGALIGEVPNSARWIASSSAATGAATTSPGTPSSSSRRVSPRSSSARASRACGRTRSSRATTSRCRSRTGSSARLPDLASNPRITHGRTWYYNHLLLATAP